MHHLLTALANIFDLLHKHWFAACSVGLLVWLWLFFGVSAKSAMIAVAIFYGADFIWFYLHHGDRNR